MNLMRPLNIMLAEDEQSVAFSIAFALRLDGHEIEVVPDGEQALLKLKAEPRAFDVLITDNNMPRMTGLELVRRLRDTAFSGKILVLSAHLSRDNRALYSELGVDEMMAKPFDLYELRDVIRQFVRGVQGTTCDHSGNRPDESVPSQLDPTRLSQTQVYKLLRLALPEFDEPDEPAASF
jgi:DNA-binding response OmpR family regulator